VRFLGFGRGLPPLGLTRARADHWAALLSSGDDHAMQLHTRAWSDASLEKTAVLLHGLAGSADTWDETAAALVTRGYCCVAPDLRGHGDSPNPDDTFEMPVLVDDVAASVPVAPDLLIGFSLGSGIALLAARAGRLVPKRLVLIDPALRSRGASQAEPSLQTIEASHAPLTTTRWGAVRRTLASSELWDALPALDVLAGRIPTLVVLAGRRSNVSPADAQALAAKLGSGAVVTIPGAPHAVHRSHLPDFLTALDGWLAGQSIANATWSADARR
jgi:pimeloyl-ACP methyl ester carboxylesterase